MNEDDIIVLSGEGLWHARLIRFDQLDSTNRWALRHTDFCRHGDVIWAVRQTAGRGRLSKLWITPDDKCLTLSFILTQFSKINSIIPLMGFISALAVRDTLEMYSIFGCLKWPNDVIVNGKKIAGVLSEVDFKNNILIMGIGVNVNLNKKELENLCLHYPITSMAEERNHLFSIHKICKTLISNIETRIEDAIKNSITHIFDEWEQYDWLTGSILEIQCEEKATRGKYLGLDEQGRIHIECEYGFERTFWSGDVEKVFMM